MKVAAADALAAGRVAEAAGEKVTAVRVAAAQATDQAADQSGAQAAAPSVAAPVFIDTHCHLDAAEFAADRAAVAVRAAAAGVGQIVVPAVTAGNFADVAACGEYFAAVRVAYGIHPLYVDGASEADLIALRERLARELDGPRPPVAVGEIGLDFFVPGADVARQTHFFVEQLKIARDFALPVLLHVRRAQDAVLAALRRVGGRGPGSALAGGIAHAFNGSRQQADAFVDQGFALGFGGAMTWSRARRIRELAATLPLSAIVLETDSPDMPPEFVGRGRNEPAHLPRIAATLAELRGMPLEAVAVATTATALRVLPGLTPSAAASPVGAPLLPAGSGLR